MHKLIVICILVLTTTIAQARTIEKNDLESFVDGVMASSMQEHHVPGVTITIVKDDKTIFSKGYGYADIEQKISVSPETSLFRIGSVSKLFVWTALMQLYERGKIDLDTDVNQYLKGVQIPEAFDKPVTITNLMTHTPGFEDYVLGLFSRTAEGMIPLVDILNEQMPARVRAPGTYASYSNHGVGIAGIIIEQVSGMPWEEFVDNNILRPLAMENTTMHQPLPQELKSHMSNSYSYANGKYKQEGFEFVPLGPAGGVSSSGDDMARFMRMFLNQGELDGARIMKTETSEKMQSPLFQAMPGGPSNLHGFYESSSHGQRIFGHGGDTIWFHSELMLLPQENLGLFISTNSANGPKVRSALKLAFLDRYFPVDREVNYEFDKTDLTTLIGDYSAIRHASEDFTKIAKLFGALKVSKNDNDELILLTGRGPQYYKEIAPYTFRHIDSETLVRFERSQEGKVSHLHFSVAPIVAFERLEGIHSLGLHNGIISLATTLFSLIVLVWGFQHFTRSWILSLAIARFHFAGWWMSATGLVFLIALSIAASDQDAIVFGEATSVDLALLITYPFTLITIALLTLLPTALKDNSVGKLSKFVYLALVVTGLGFVWFLIYWQFMF